MGTILLYLGITFVILLLIGVPIAYSLGIVGVGYFVLFGTDFGVLLTAPQTMVESTRSFSLAAIPFFVFIGELMAISGISDRVVAFARAMIGHFRGGLAMVALASSLLVAAFSGSSVANAVGTGSVTIPAMKKARYPKDFASAVKSTTSSMGTVVPPSVAMIVYASITGVSVKALFVGGYTPAIIYALGIMLVIRVVAKRGNFGRDEKHSNKERIETFRSSIGALLIPVIVMGGILLGYMTATEAGAIGGVYTLGLAVFVHRSLTWEKFKKFWVETARTTGIVMFVVATASVVGWILARERVPTTLAEKTLSAFSSQTAILIVLILMLVVLGTFMETLSALAITAPLIVGIGMGAGIDPVLLGLVTVLSLSIGMVTPPVGVVLFVTAKIARSSIEAVSMRLLPFLVVLVGGTLLMAVFPEVFLWLPNFVESLSGS